MLGGPDDPEMCVRCMRYVPLGEKCPECGEVIVDVEGVDFSSGDTTLRQCEKHGKWTVGSNSCPICASEAPSPAAIPPWLVAFRRLYGEAFFSWAMTSLHPGEEIIEASPSISENVARVDRADREGTIGVTNQRVVFVSIKRGVLWHDIDLRTVGPVSFEGRRNVFISLEIPGEGQARLMVGKKQAKRLRPALELALQMAKRPGR